MLRPDDFYVWEAVTHEGTIIREDDDPNALAACTHNPDFPNGHPGMEHAFACILGANIAGMAAVPTPEAFKAGHRRHIVAIPEGARPIFLRRRGDHFNLNTQEHVSTPGLTLLGYQYNERRRNHKVVLGIDEDGAVTLAQDDSTATFFPAAPAEWENPA